MASMQVMPDGSTSYHTGVLLLLLLLLLLIIMMIIMIIMIMILIVFNTKPLYY